MAEQRGDGRVVWFEIPVADLERAARFYRGLFGWELEPFREYDADYWLIRGCGEGVNGALCLRPEQAGAAGGTMLYLQVEKLDAAIEAASRLDGAQSLRPRLITKSAGSYAWIRDTEGNTIGLWSPEQSVR